MDLTIADGEFMVLVGPSGLREEHGPSHDRRARDADRRQVLIGDRDVTELPPQERDVAMVFQSYALYPHMTVRENLAFGLAHARRGIGAPSPSGWTGRQGARPRSVLHRKPGQLSGGQRQRVAFGRAIVREPPAFLFDEPLSNLDAKLRLETRAELARLHRRLAATMVYVTHDQEEALTLGSRVAVMHEGQVEQVGPPLEVYRRPATVFVATFVGSPAMNLLPADLLAGARDGARLRTTGATLGVRPHDIAIVEEGHAATSTRWWTWWSRAGASSSALSSARARRRRSRGSGHHSARSRRSSPTRWSGFARTADGFTSSIRGPARVGWRSAATGCHR